MATIENDPSGSTCRRWPGGGAALTGKLIRGEQFGRRQVLAQCVGHIGRGVAPVGVAGDGRAYRGDQFVQFCGGTHG
jgi:hypothetical protein